MSVSECSSALDIVTSDGERQSGFDRYFDVVRARSADLLDEIYRLRYQVYCVENQFLRTVDCADGREMDCYDECAALSIALLYRPRRELAGSARVIPAGALNGARLPIETVIDSGGAAELARWPRTAMGEISRYSVSKVFRRRMGESEFPDVGWSTGDLHPRRVLPYLTLGLMRGIIAVGIEAQVQMLCACMRPALIRLLRQFGLQFRPLGRTIDYHGIRQPCMLTMEEILHWSAFGEFASVVGRPVFDDAAWMQRLSHQLV